MTTPSLSHRRSPTLAIALLLGASLPGAGCLMAQNDSLEVGGVMPSPFVEKPDTIGREQDAPSVTSLDRANWGDTAYAVPNEMVAHRPTYARRNTRYAVSSRASGEYPTLAEAITLPRGPSENEQIYDALTWPILIMPAAFLIPVGLIFEPWIAVTNESPSWEYERHPQGVRPGDRVGPTGDPVVDRLGLPVVDETPAIAPTPSPEFQPVEQQPAASPPAAAPTTPGGGGR